MSETTIDGDHLGRLRAMIAPDRQTRDLSPGDVKAIEWALARIASQRATIDHQRYQVAVGVEARGDARVIRDGTLARWERSLQEVIDAAERAKRKVSEERALLPG